MSEYTLISDGKVVGEAGTFKDACELAKEESKVDKGVSRVCLGQKRTGRIVSVWSGPIAPWSEGSTAVRGITKHASYACGFGW